MSLFHDLGGFPVEIETPAMKNIAGVSGQGLCDLSNLQLRGFAKKSKFRAETNTDSVTSVVLASNIGGRVCKIIANRAGK